MSSESHYARRAARFYGPERVQKPRAERVAYLRTRIEALERQDDAENAAHRATCPKCQRGDLCFEVFCVNPEQFARSDRLRFLRSLIWHEEQDELYAERARIHPVEYRDHIDGFCRYWQNLRYRKFEAVERKCERCGKLAQLDAHHLHYDTFGFEELCDLQALCRGCHESTHRGGRIERLRQFVQHRER